MGLRDNQLTIFEHPHNQFIKSIVFRPDGLSLISGGGWNSTIESWNLKSKQSLLTIEGHSDGIFQLSIDPSGTLLASASWDGTIMVWDMAVNRRQAVSQNIDILVTDLSFNFDGTLLATGILDGAVRFYDSQSAKEIWQVHPYEAYQIM